MDQIGMWNLFVATGLPELYLAARAQRRDQSVPPREEAPLSEGERAEKPPEKGPF